MNFCKKLFTAAMTMMSSLTMMFPNSEAFSSTVMHRLEVDTFDSGGTLIFSDSPEYVKENGILYRDVVEGDCRVLFYHLNDSRTNKNLAVIVENVSGQMNTVNITRGAISKPTDKFLHAGKSVQTDYMKDDFHDTIYLLKNDKRFLHDSMRDLTLRPGQLVYGVYDFHTELPVKISVIMYSTFISPFTFMEYAPILPKDEQRLRGTFKNMNRTMRAKKIYNPESDGIVYIMIGDNVNDIFKTGIDATDGSEVVNFGNYGVNYNIEFRSKGDTRTGLVPLGGMYAGAVRSNYNGKSNIMLTPEKKTYFGDATPKEPESVKKAREEGLSIFTNYTELAELGTYKGNFNFEYSPPGASNLPVNIVLMPTEK